MSKFFTNTSPGIAVATRPYLFIPVGNELDRHVRVSIGKNMPPQLVTRPVEGMRFDRQYVDRGSFIKRAPRDAQEGRPQRHEDRILIISERDNDRQNAVLLAVLPSGYQGDSVISVHTGAQILADCFTGHGVCSDAGVSHHVLAYMSPGGELRGRTSGHRVRACFRWVFDGEEILQFQGDEDIFLNASEHMAHVDGLDE